MIIMILLIFTIISITIMIRIIIQAPRLESRKTPRLQPIPGQRGLALQGGPGVGEQRPLAF